MSHAERGAPGPRRSDRSRWDLAVRSAVFTIVVPGTGGVGIPWWILTHGGAMPRPEAWPGTALIVAGAALYVRCLVLFAVVGGGTPGLWDAPRRFVSVGPYRWVRNPIYLSALLVVVGEAWLFLSPPLLGYTAGMALACHLLVTGYEEPTLHRAFGDRYAEYRRTVPRWIPRRPSDRPGRIAH